MAPPRVLANRYRLEATIGEGGMGIVHRAIDLELERAVAIKVLSASEDQAALERFLVEAKRTAAVRHPSIIEVFDVGRDGPDAFLVMELLLGETLAQRLARGPTPAAEAIAIGVQICEALAAAHEAGLVHRDLKPANVFLVRGGDAEARVKLLDFGIAKRIDGATARTDPNMIVGTIEYLSPEQIRGGALDGRSDLYALGVTLYRMLAGALPFKGENIATIIHQHLSVAPVSLRERAPDLAIPARLDAAVLRLLAKSPGDRPASARDAKRELLAALEPAGAPVEGPTGAASPYAPAPLIAAPLQSAEPPRRGTERLVDFEHDDDEPLGGELELDRSSHGTALQATPSARTRGPAIVPVAPLAPLPPVAPLAELQPAPLPAWLTPLAEVPAALSKRVAGYSLFALLLHLVFFSGSLLPRLGLACLATAGALAFWAHHRRYR
jgi:serine/threonine-protein kinase